ncbi:Hypothetical protein HVR_LOCUS667 [uncultured virus]|nr:Hypothetical protein HVR_LOCUS667 [uncultured virus]
MPVFNLLRGQQGLPATRCNEVASTFEIEPSSIHRGIFDAKAESLIPVDQTLFDLPVDEATHCLSKEQDPQSPIHVIHLGCSIEDKTLMAWNIIGSKSWHTGNNARKFIDFCKEKLPSRQLPIRIEWTGYIKVRFFANLTVGILMICEEW